MYPSGVKMKPEPEPMSRPPGVRLVSILKKTPVIVCLPRSVLFGPW